VGGTEFIVGFESSQALPVCLSGKFKILTGTILINNIAFYIIYREALL
jgi:hypothetical protein